MLVDEIAPEVLLPMAYTRKRAETIVTGLEFQLNLHLLKLAAVPLTTERPHSRREVTAWLAAIAAIRLKPSTRPASASFYYDILFEEPFGGNEVEAVAARLQLLRQQYGRLDPDADPASLAARLQAFHTAFAHGCSEGATNILQINGLIERL